jgi:ADP-heptose:LPS heptosyltransferase
LNKTAANHERSSGRNDASPRILVIRSGAIGDTLMATPLLRSLRKAFPRAYIAALASQKAVDVLRYNPHIDEVFALRRRHLPFFLSREKRRLVRHFREHGLDIIISLETHKDFTDLACRLNPKKLVTFDRAANCGEVIHLDTGAAEHSVELNLRAGTVIGAEPAGIETEFYYPAELKSHVASRLAESGIGDSDVLIGIHAGWGGRRQDPEDTRLKSWPASRFAELIRRIGASTNAKFVLTGSGLDGKLNEIISRAAGVPVINAAGQFSLLESAALIDRMDLYVTIDSGPAHIAAAVGTPLIVLWGPSILSAVRPFPGKAALRILREPPPCAPCYNTELMKTCKDNVCMKNIEVASVVSAVDEILSDAVTAV